MLFSTQNLIFVFLSYDPTKNIEKLDYFFCSLLNITQKYILKKCEGTGV